MLGKRARLGREAAAFAEKAKKIYAPAQVILFGSRARGDWLESSDYDFIIISPKFEGVDFLDRIKNAFLNCKAFFPADILCYTPAEFEKKRGQIGTVSQAAAQGVIV